MCPQQEQSAHAKTLGLVWMTADIGKWSVCSQPQSMAYTWWLAQPDQRIHQQTTRKPLLANSFRQAALLHLLALHCLHPSAWAFSLGAILLGFKSILFSAQCVRQRGKSWCALDSNLFSHSPECLLILLCQVTQLILPPSFAQFHTVP